MDTTNQLPDNHRTPLPSVDANIATDGTLKVAYLMSRFPKLTETFVLFEILAVQQQGVQVEVFPLLRGRGSDRSVAGAGIWQKLAEYLQPRTVEPAMHREASPLVEQAHYEPFVSWPILKSNVAMLSTRPGRYVGLVSRLIRGNLGSANRLLGSLALLPKMVHFARRMQSLGVDHVHAHFANHPATAAFVIHYLTGIPYSFTPHGSDLHRDQRMLRDKVADASFVVAISKYNGQFIREHCGEVATNKIRLLHCGVDRNVFCRVRRPDQAAGRNLQVLCIGTLHEVKGQQWILRAMADEDSPPMDLHLVGDGPDRDALTALAQDLGIAGRVRFYGQQTRPELLETLGRCGVRPCRRFFA